MQGLLPNIIFYVFAGLALVSGFFAIIQSNPVRCVLFLVLAFFASSVLWLLVHAEFLALILVLVYVGAVMTLFLFVVMMLNIDMASKHAHFLRYLPFGLILVAFLTALLLKTLPADRFQTSVEVSSAVQEVVAEDFVPDTQFVPAKPISNTEELGLVLYTEYVFAFELAAVILLVAIIAAITLVHRAPIRSKQQNITRQIMTRREDRVTLVKMKSEK